MLILRMLRMVLHVLVGSWTCALVFPRLDAIGREQRIRRWSQRLLELCRVHVRVNGEPVPRALVVANHLSWLDIYVINARHPRRFVAKDSIRNWPVIGWLSEKTGTVFLQRGNPRDLRRIFRGLAQQMQAGERFAFFPEGTTSYQGKLLPFHPNLFEAAIDAGVPVQPYALRYLDVNGNPHPTIEFVGDMSMMESIVAIAGGSEIIVELQILPVLPTQGASRRELAIEARRMIASALGQEADAADNRPAAPPDSQVAQQ